MEVIVLACFDMIRVTGCPVCCTSRRGSTATLAMTTAADSYEGPCRWRSPRSIGRVCTTTPARTGYSATSPSATEAKQKDTSAVNGVIKYLTHISSPVLSNLLPIIQRLLSFHIVSAVLSVPKVFHTDSFMNRSGQAEVRCNAELEKQFIAKIRSQKYYLFG